LLSHRMAEGKSGLLASGVSLLPLDERLQH
jgi:hypothetical protein